MKHSLARLLAAVVIGAAASVALPAADRQWQTGTWREPPDARSYVIATDAVRLFLEDPTPRDTRAIDAQVGTSVRFAVEGTRVFVEDRRRVEHELRLVRQLDLKYAATGAGHLIRAISADGLTLTLEDGSTWALHPRAQFFTIEWQRDEGISVRRVDPEDGFDYEIDNIDRDQGAPARYSPN